MRYHVVTVSKFIGMYRKHDPVAYMVADHEQANRIIGRKFDTWEQAQQGANTLNGSTADQTAESMRGLADDVLGGK